MSNLIFFSFPFFLRHHWIQIQNNKQTVSTLKRKNSDAVEDLRPPDASANRITSRWNNEELLLAVQGVRKFGKDFLTIADMIGTKTEAQVRTFFVNYRRRYNLDNMVTEFETNAKKQQKEQQQQQQQQTQPIDANMIREQEPEIMEVSFFCYTERLVEWQNSIFWFNVLNLNQLFNRFWFELSGKHLCNLKPVTDSMVQVHW